MEKQNRYIAPLSLASGVARGLTLISVIWWLKSAGVSNTKIGIFNIVNFLPLFNFIWIPIFDKVDLKSLLSRLGIKFEQSIQRKGFVIVSSFFSFLFIYIASLIGVNNLLLFGILMCFANFWTANCDAIATAYIYETIQPSHMGISTAAYRIGIFFSGTLTLFIHEQIKIPWPILFQVISVFIVILNSSILFAPPERPAKIKTINEAFIKPYKELINTYGSKLFSIILFMAIYKIEERFVAPMEAIFLRENLQVNQYTLVKFLSTFALAFAAVKSGSLISRFGYGKTFAISIFASVGLVFCYLLCGMKTQTSYIASILIGSILFLIFHRLRKSRIPYWLISILTVVLPLFLYVSGVKLNIIAIFSLVVIAKMISGIRNSLFYSYQCALSSKEHALSQITMITSLERIVSQPIAMLSGFCVDKSGWVGFYSINLLMTLLPLFMIRFAYYPKVKK